VKAAAMTVTIIRVKTRFVAIVVPANFSDLRESKSTVRSGYHTHPLLTTGCFELADLALQICNS